MTRQHQAIPRTSPRLILPQAPVILVPCLLGTRAHLCLGPAKPASQGDDAHTKHLFLPPNFFIHYLSTNIDNGEIREFRFGLSLSAKRALAFSGPEHRSAIGAAKGY